MEKLKKIYQENRKIFLLLLVVFLVGIFLRTYKFHDWLRFSVDQSRDASIIDNALEGKAPLPLLGPKANTTTFQLGPAYYYFSYLSARIFGYTAESMAFPSLISAILVIPLLFLFTRKFFSDRISLMLTAIVSVSYIMVANSRLSSNPNLIPFFILLYLYAASELLDANEKPKFLWSAALGVALGIGVQLHTTFFVIMPVVTVIIFAYLFYRRVPGTGRNLVMVIALGLLLNASQFVSEFDSGGRNAKSFFSGFQKNKDSHILRNIADIVACQAQANSYYISSINSVPMEKSDNASCSEILNRPRGDEHSRAGYYYGIAWSIIFSLVGYFLLIKRFWQEQDEKKKNFLGLILLLNAVSFIILVPIAGMMITTYFVVLFIVPFILCGLMFEALENRFGAIGRNAVLLGLTMLIILGLSRDWTEAKKNMAGLNNDAKHSTLLQVERIARYIIDRSEINEKVYFSGQTDLVNRFWKPVNYFTRKNGVVLDVLPRIKSGTKLDMYEPLFYITDKEKAAGYSSRAEIAGRKIVEREDFSNQSIFLLEN